MTESNSNPTNMQNNTSISDHKYDFDELKMYFSEPYLVPLENGRFIEINQPSMGLILEIGDRQVYSSINPFVGNTTTYRVTLWDAGIDWNKISDFELFRALIPSIGDVDFLFKLVTLTENSNWNANDPLSDKYCIKKENIQFSKLKEYHLTKENKGCEETQEIVLYDPEQELIITEDTYLHIREYLRMMFDQHPKVELAKGKLAKQWIIDEEKENMRLEAQKNDRKKSVLLPLVSGLLNHPGFKYDLDGMKNLGIFAFMDSARRLQIYEQCIAFMGGMYSGFMDTSKLGQEELNKRVNWLQDVYTGK